jgi:hypothetical protein
MARLRLATAAPKQGFGVGGNALVDCTDIHALSCRPGNVVVLPSKCWLRRFKEA